MTASLKKKKKKKNRAYICLFILARTSCPAPSASDSIGCKNGAQLTPQRGLAKSILDIQCLSNGQRQDQVQSRVDDEASDSRCRDGRCGLVAVTDWSTGNE